LSLRPPYFLCLSLCPRRAPLPSVRGMPWPLSSACLLVPRAVAGCACYPCAVDSICFWCCSRHVFSAFRFARAVLTCPGYMLVALSSRLLNCTAKSQDCGCRARLKDEHLNVLVRRPPPDCIIHSCNYALKRHSSLYLASVFRDSCHFLGISFFT
jgi:hypothetical protein